MSDNADEAREQCHAIFNNTAFADVVLAVNRLMSEAADGTVTTRKVAAELRVSDSIVRPVMVRLVTAQLLDELPRRAANGPRLFHRRNEDRWTAMCALVAAVQPQEPAPPRRGPAKRS